MCTHMHIFLGNLPADFQHIATLWYHSSFQSCFVVCFISFSDCKCIFVPHFAAGVSRAQLQRWPDAIARILHELSASLSSHISSNYSNHRLPRPHCRTYPVCSILRSHYGKNNTFFLLQVSVALSQQVTDSKKAEFWFHQMHRDGQTSLLEPAPDLCAISRI